MKAIRPTTRNDAANSDMRTVCPAAPGSSARRTRNESAAIVASAVAVTTVRIHRRVPGGSSVDSRPARGEGSAPERGRRSSSSRAIWARRQPRRPRLRRYPRPGRRRRGRRRAFDRAHRLRARGRAGLISTQTPLAGAEAVPFRGHHYRSPGRVIITAEKRR